MTLGDLFSEHLGVTFSLAIDIAAFSLCRCSVVMQLSHKRESKSSDIPDKQRVAFREEYDGGSHPPDRRSHQARMQARSGATS